MDNNSMVSTAYGTGIGGAILFIAGIALSGPVWLAIVAAVSPSQTWEGSAVFAQYLHPVHTLPFFFGFAMITGYVILLIQLHLPNHLRAGAFGRLPSRI